MAQKKKTNRPPIPDWNSVLESLKSAGTGDYFFVKSPRTRMRLICLDPDPMNFFVEATTYYRGKPKSKYVVFAQLLASEGGDKGPLGDQWKGKLVPVVITKTALQGILHLLAEGYELLDPEEGFGITILRTGSGTDTDYTVTPSPAPVAVDLEALEYPEKTLIEFAEELTQKNLSRSGSGSPDETGDWN